MLTDAACRNAKPKDKPYKLSDGFGLYLEVLPTGGRSWRWKYRFAGKEKRLVFGTYPDVSLADAREKREADRKLLAQGIDPGAQKQDAKRQARLNAENTLEAIARNGIPINAKSGRSVCR